MRYFYLERIGGAEVQAYILAKELTRRGWEVHYVSESKNCEKPRVDNIEGITTHWLKIRKYFDWLNMPVLYHILRSVKPDYIYNRYTSSYTAISGYYSRLNKCKFIWVCTDYSMTFRWAFLRVRLRQLKTHDLVLWKKILAIVFSIINDVFVRIGLYFVDLGVALSEEERNRIRINFNLKRTDILPLGHDIPQKKPVNYEVPIILWAGSMGEGKWPEGFIEIAKLCENLHCEFWLLGDTENAKRKNEVLEKATRLKNFKYFPGVNFDQTNDFYKKATLFVNTTKLKGGGVGNTNAQALIWGIPIISVNVDPGNIIRNHFVGILSGDVKNAANEIKELLNNTDKYNSLARNARTYAERYLSKEEMVKKFEKLLEGL